MRFFKNYASIYKSSAVVGIWTLISRLLGFVRDILFAVFLGSGPVADAFLIAFRLPNLFRRFFAEGTFSAAFIPLLSEKNKNYGLEEGLIFTSQITTILLLFVLPIIFLAELFMPSIVLLIAPGFQDDLYRLDIAIPYARIVFPYLIFIIITSLLASSLNINGKFWAGAAAPVILNLSMIFAMLFAFRIGADKGLFLSWGVLIAGAFQMLLLAWANYKNGLAFNINIPSVDIYVKKFINRFIPAALGAGATQINLLVSSIFASQIPGAISWLYYSDRIAQLPLGIIAVAIGTVLLPDLSKIVAANNKKDEYLTQERAILIAIFFALPSSAALIYMPDLIIKSLFGYGNFTSTDEVYTSLSLMVYALGIPAFMLIKIFAPFFFARQDIRTPLMVTVFTSFINILLTWYLLGVLGFIGIAYSLIISGWLNALILFVLVLLKKFYIPKLKTFIKILFIFLSTILMLLSLIALDSLFINFNENILKLILMIVVGTSTYLFSCYLLGLFKYLK